MLGEGSGGVSCGGLSEEVLVLLILLPSVVGGEKNFDSSEGFSEVLVLLILLLPERHNCFCL